jgi:hypothetical protein
MALHRSLAVKVPLRVHRAVHWAATRRRCTVQDLLLEWLGPHIDKLPLAPEDRVLDADGRASSDAESLVIRG